MKNVTKKTKAIFIIFAIVIIAGITAIATMGFNTELSMQNNNRIELNIGKDFEISDIKDITNDVFGDSQTIIQKVEVFEDTARITVKEIKKKKKNQLVEKINEKYSVELKADEIEIQSNTNMKISDLMKPYISLFGLASALILVYMIVKYRKLGMLKVLLKTLCTILITQAVLFSLIALMRIPIGRFTIPMVIVVYIATLFVITYNSEKKLAKLLNEEK